MPAGLPARPRQRSTKAGAPTPATREASGPGAKRPATPYAQRRPGLPPRRHALEIVSVRFVKPRSTKAGAPTPATPLARNSTSAGRSTKAGAPTPATPPRGGLATTPAKAGAPTPATPMIARPRHNGRAQRRPGLPPRRHAHESSISPRPDTRSTKAGAPTPATPASQSGSRGPTQRRPGLPPRRHEEAGAVPATLRPPDGQPWADAQRRGSHRRRPLNEGRGSHPGDTSLNEGRGSHPGDTRQRDGSAQRRRGSHPGDTDSLNEGRGSHPGDTANRAFCSETGSPLGQTALVDHVCAVYLREGRGSHHRICFPGDSQP